MKRTELERRERELNRSKKRQEVAQRRDKRENSETKLSISDYINVLSDSFLHDEIEIFNIETDIKILEILEDLKSDISQNKWEDVIRKAVRKKKIKNKEEAIQQLKDLL